MLESISVIEKIKADYSSLFEKEKKIADYIINNYINVASMNVSVLAKECKVSDATIVRFCQHIGYQGYHELRLYLSRDIGRDEEFINATNENNFLSAAISEDISIIKNMQSLISNETLIDVSNHILKAKNVFIVGVGNAISVACDLEFRLNRLGIRAYSNSQAERFLNYISLGDKNDIVIGISNSGESKRVIQALEIAKKKKMFTIVYTSDETSPIVKEANRVLQISKKNKLFPKYTESSSYLCSYFLNDAVVYTIKKIKQSSKNDSDSIELTITEKI